MNWPAGLDVRFPAVPFNRVFQDTGQGLHPRVRCMLWNLVEAHMLHGTSTSNGTAKGSYVSVIPKNSIGTPFTPAALPEAVHHEATVSLS